jgi:hypothetical protein
LEGVAAAAPIAAGTATTAPAVPAPVDSMPPSIPPASDAAAPPATDTMVVSPTIVPWSDSSPQSLVALVSPPASPTASSAAWADEAVVEPLALSQASAELPPVIADEPALASTIGQDSGSASKEQPAVGEDRSTIAKDALAGVFLEGSLDLDWLDGRPVTTTERVGPGDSSHPRSDVAWEQLTDELFAKLGADGSL